jgi:deazaflavin-dependent oxidoreductase (nitroreductase family)
VSVRTARLGRRLAGTRWFRLWAVLRHVGRRSGRAYEIPIVAFPTADGFLIPLPFGDATQWLKNLQAADTAGLRRAGRDFVIERPEVVRLDDIGQGLPRPIRFAAGTLGIDDFVHVRTTRP